MIRNFLLQFLQFTPTLTKYTHSYQAIAKCFPPHGILFYLIYSKARHRNYHMQIVVNLVWIEIRDGSLL